MAYRGVTPSEVESRCPAAGHRTLPTLPTSNRESPRSPLPIFCQPEKENLNDLLRPGPDPDQGDCLSQAKRLWPRPDTPLDRATYREILERRAKENGIDFFEGVTTAITPLALLETIMVRGYQTLVDEGTTVSYRDAMDAALKLNEIARKDEGALERAQTLAEMGRIIEVVRTFIPSERWPEVQAALRGETPASRQTSQPVDGVRMVDIDDTPDENDD